MGVPTRMTRATRACAVLGLTAAALTALGGTPPTHAAMRTGGFGPTTLQITTTTDTLPGAAAIGHLAVPGQPVVRTYKLTNASEATLVNVTVSDPDAWSHQERARGADTVRCGTHPGPITLPAWSSIVCKATFPAIAGTHRTVVSARGAAEGTGIVLSGSDIAGYQSGADTLALRETFDFAPAGSAAAYTRSAGGRAVHVRYAVVVSGPVPLVNVSVGESLPVTGLACPPDGTVIASLNPAAEAHCAAELFTLPGVYTGLATAAGMQSLPSISPHGPGPARLVQAAAASRFQLATPPVPPPRPATAASTTGVTTGRRHPHALTADSAATTGVPQPSVGSVPIVLAANPGTNTGAKPSSRSHSGSGRTYGLLPRRKHSELSLLLLLLVVLLPAPVTLLLGHGLRRRR